MTEMQKNESPVASEETPVARKIEPMAAPDHAPIRLRIFDADGTLLDSMPMWEHLGERYLTLKGIPIPDRFLEAMYAMTLMESSAWFHELGVAEDPQTIEREIIELANRAYRTEIPLLPEVLASLVELAKDGVPMVVFSTSAKELLETAFARTGILSYFREIYTPETLGEGKDTPISWQAVCEREGVRPAESCVYEDSEYAIETALAAGCRVIDVTAGGLLHGAVRREAGQGQDSK